MIKNHPILQASEKDITELVQLINSAYRGESSKKGWTTEADLLGGIRTDENSILDMMHKPDAVILKSLNDKNQIIGCVYLQKQNDQLYLGMLTVAPKLQAQGIGKQLLAAADQYALQQDCRLIAMTVISIRHELIAWYERHGYHKTDKTTPFPDDPRFGIPTQPLEFVVLEKMMKTD